LHSPIIEFSKPNPDYYRTNATKEESTLLLDIHSEIDAKFENG